MSQNFLNPKNQILRKSETNLEEVLCGRALRNFEIRYHEIVPREDIPRLSSSWRIRIKTAIETRLSLFPELYGKPLRRSLKGYRKLRVGDYRVIFKMEKRLVKIVIIGHRSTIYKEIEKRV